MRTAIALSAALSVVSCVAYAGPCTDRISAVEKKLSASDAGSGPTIAAPAETATPNPGVPKAGETPGTGGTAGMNATVGNRAASPSDVRAQTSGQPTAAQGGASMAKEVSDALARAKAADQSGDAAACGQALDDVERLTRG